MHIRPFNAVRPPPELADRVAAPPYDVVDTRMARELAEGNPMCFLRVTRPELELPPDIDAHDDAVYTRAGANYRAFLDRGYLQPDPASCLYVYRITAGQHEQTGLVALCSVDDYAANVIRRHEKTRAVTETDRTRHIAALEAQTGPVFLLHRDHDRLAALLLKAAAAAPLYDIGTPQGVRHRVWRLTEMGEALRAFTELDGAYVADGHHRAAAALRVARERGDEESRWFLSALFPASQLRVLAYNRIVADLHGREQDEFLSEVGRRFEVVADADPVPGSPCRVSMFVGGRWYGISWPAGSGDDPAGALDVSVLQDRLLDPVLGITDPRQDPRISFLGGIHGTRALEQRVNEGKARVAFSMYPTSVQQLMEVADRGGVMPPKSTWFEPKLRSGLLVHPLGG